MILLVGDFPANPVYGYSKFFVRNSDNTCSDDFTLSEAFLLDTCMFSIAGSLKYSCKITKINR